MFVPLYMFQTLVHRQGFFFLSLKATILQLHNFEVQTALVSWYWSIVAFKDKKPPDDELRFETYIGVQTFYKSYNKSGF
jgi:hypothetical protein